MGWLHLAVMQQRVEHTKDHKNKCKHSVERSGASDTVTERGLNIFKAAIITSSLNLSVSVRNYPYYKKLCIYGMNGNKVEPQ